MEPAAQQAAKDFPFRVEAQRLPALYSRCSPARTYFSKYRGGGFKENEKQIHIYSYLLAGGMIRTCTFQGTVNASNLWQWAPGASGEQQLLSHDMTDVIYGVVVIVQPAQPAGPELVQPSLRPQVGPNPLYLLLRIPQWSRKSAAVTVNANPD